MNPQQVNLFVWAALALSQLVYLFIPAPPRENTGEISGAFPLVLGIVAVLQAILIAGLLQLRAFKPIQAGQLDPTSKAGAAQLFTTLMIAWVLAESVAIYGLVLRFLQFPLTTSLPFSLAGAFLLFLGRPWNSRLRRPESAAELARSGAPLR